MIVTQLGMVKVCVKFIQMLQIIKIGFYDKCYIFISLFTGISIHPVAGCFSISTKNSKQQEKSTCKQEKKNNTMITENLKEN